MVTINQIEGNKVYPTQEEYNEQELSLIPFFDSSSVFVPNIDSVVFTVKTSEGELVYRDTELDSYTVRNNRNTIESGVVQSIVLYPLVDLENAGYDVGNYNIYYNFFGEALSSKENTFFIKEISPSRTEIRISTNNDVSNGDLQQLVNDLSQELFGGSFLKDFYVNIEEEYYIANNVLLDTTTSPNTVLIKLYQPLPTNITLNTILKVFLEKAETVGYNINIPSLPIEEEEKEYIKGPNFNIPIQGEINNSIEETTLDALLNNTELTSSYDKLQNILNKKGIEVNIDYSSFENFIHFSSAEQRVQNFYYKVSLIQSASNSINELGAITGSNRTSTETSSSISKLESDITNIIKNFDGYENYLYYNSSSLVYPKSNSTPPYNLLPTGSTEVLQWLGSSGENNLYYGGLLYSASVYDNNNPDGLINSIPNYLAEDPDNDGYKLFLSMIGQHFDILYSYIKAISQRYNADNRLDYGISKDLVGDALKSMGINLYQNNFSSEGLYAGLIGINDSGSLLPPTGSEVVHSYVTASEGVVPLDDLTKETYKRIYHNLPYLLKKKGTVAGLRALLTCYGIPDTILRVSEFGGKDKIASNDWDFYQNVFSYYLTNTGSEDAYASVPWVVNPRWNSEGNVPETVVFRFKPNNILPNEDEYSIVTSISGSIGTSFLTLEYTGSGFGSGSYSGSIPSASNNYATLKYYNTSSEAAIVSMSAPFYNGEWWAVYLNRNNIQGSGEIYTLKAGCKIYNGDEGFKMGPTGSGVGGSYYNSNLYNSNAETWPSGSEFYVAYDTSSAVNINGSDHLLLTGSWQELRYYNDSLSQKVFENYVMNPYSVEGTSSIDPSENVIFRAPLSLRGESGSEGLIKIEGGDYIIDENLGDSLGFISIHPKVTGSYEFRDVPFSFHSIDGYATSSFITTYFTGSVYGVAVYGESEDQYGKYTPETGSNIYQIYKGLTFKGQTEYYYYEQVPVGIKNKVSEKIDVISSSLASGDVLSLYSTIQQQYNSPNSQSYTKDINYGEIAFSPQNEINDNINSSFGNFNIGDYIGDPRQISSSTTSYPNLDKLRDQYFYKYYKNYNWKDYIRLIKYFDNSLFKLIKDFTPARSSITTGVVIKQHLLERNRHRPTQVEFTRHEYTSSLLSGFTSGSDGGVYSKYNSTGLSDNEQVCIKTLITPSGSLLYSSSTQDEFYNGELCGSEISTLSSTLNSSPIEISTTSSIFSFSKSGNKGVYILTSSVEFDPPLNNNRNTIGNLIFYIPNSDEGITHIQISATTPTGESLTSSLDLYQSGDILPIRLQTTNGNYPTQPNSQIFNFIIRGITKNYDSSEGEYYYLVEVNNPRKSFEGAPIFVENNGQFNTISSIDIIMNISFNNEGILNSLPNNPLLGNITDIRRSQIYMEVDYSSRAVIPINYSQIINNTAKRAEVQDFNYNSTLKNSKYEGNRISSPDFNTNIIN